MHSYFTMPPLKKTKLKTSAQKRLRIAFARKDFFSTAQAIAIGVSQSTLSRLARDKFIIRIAHGRFTFPNSPSSPEKREFSLALSSFRGPAIIGGLSALSYYDLYEQPLMKIWVLIPPNSSSKKNLLKCIRTTLSLDISVVKHRGFSIISLERALVEAFYYPSISLRTALLCARRAIARRKTTPAKIVSVARELGIETRVLKHWESITPESWDGQ